MPKTTKEYENLGIEKTLAELKSDRQQGLSEAEAQKRLAEYGYNEIPEKEESTLHRVFRRFWGPIP